MANKTLRVDPRAFQVIFQAIFLSYGILTLNWTPDWSHYIITISGCLLFQYSAESIKAGKWQLMTDFDRWGFSVLISAMSLCLLLKSNHWQTATLAAFLTVSSKYFFRIGRKHIFNPSAFGIIATIFLTNDAWLSPGQWGSDAVIFFTVVSLGIIVVTRVQKLDVSLAFLITFVALLYWRQVYVLGWPMDYFIHSISTGSLLLFSFFMISDPRTSPDHSIARVLWAVLIAVVSFYLAAFKWKYNTPLWVLVAAAPLVPMLDSLFKAKRFSWTMSIVDLTILFKLKKIRMKPFMKKFAASVILVALISHEALAFCGFYVAKADGTLKNKTSQVILVRDGDQNVITMYNDFQGNFKDFAMVVPVPVVLKQKDIKVVDPQIFTTLNEYSKPRLVEYYDQNPCQPQVLNEVVVTGLAGRVPGVSISQKSEREYKVKIEAQYLIGEYDIMILSASESSGLKEWLNENGYKVPPGADEVLEPYIKSNLKFFVVKVNEKEKKKLKGNFLRPIQISFKSPKFMLPIRLGMANSDGDQDMLVYAFTKKGRVECTNYRTVSLPTGNNIPVFVLNNFGNFYANLFQHQWKREGKSVVMLEYAWNVSPKNYVKCDPCVATAPSAQDLVNAGVWWIGNNFERWGIDDEDISGDVHFTRLHVRYNRQSFPQDLIFQVTPNTESYQARYVINHPASGDFSCDEGKKYVKQLKERRQDELDMLHYLTGKDYSDWDVVMNDEEKNLPTTVSYKTLAMNSNKKDQPDRRIIFAAFGLIGMISLVGLGRRKV